MKKILLSILFAVLSFSAFADNFIEDQPIVQNETKRSEYRGKVLLNTHCLGVIPLGVSTVHGVYFTRSGFFIGGAVSTRYWPDLPYKSQYISFAVHPEWYFVRGKKVEWSMSIGLGVAGTYMYRAENGGYVRRGYWESWMPYFAPSIGLSINLSDKVALDIALKLEGMTSTYVTPMYTFGVRF